MAGLSMPTAGFAWLTTSPMRGDSVWSVLVEPAASLPPPRQCHLSAGFQLPPVPLPLPPVRLLPLLLPKGRVIPVPSRPRSRSTSRLIPVRLLPRLLPLLLPPLLPLLLPKGRATLVPSHLRSRSTYRSIYRLLPPQIPIQKLLLGLLPLLRASLLLPRHQLLSTFPLNQYPCEW